MKALATVIATLFVAVSLALMLTHFADKRSKGEKLPEHDASEVPVVRTLDKQLNIVCYITPTSIACLRIGVDL